MKSCGKRKNKVAACCTFKLLPPFISKYFLSFRLLIPKIKKRRCGKQLECTVTTKKQLGPYARNLKQFAFVNIITQSQNMCKFLGCYLGILPLYIGIRIDENISNIYTAAL